LTARPTAAAQPTAPDHHVACHYAHQIDPQTLIRIAGRVA